MTDLSLTATNVGPAVDLDDKYIAGSGRVYLTGLQAMVRIPMDQLRADRRVGLRTASFISGYPGSPLAGFDRELQARRHLLDALDIVHRPGLNEELAATSVMGSQTAMNFGTLRVDGVLGIWYGKAPGLDRATDAIRHGNFYGVTRHGGALLLVGDDPTSKSSSVPSGSEMALADLATPILVPGNSQEALDLGLHAVALSRNSGLWVALRVVTSVADGAGTVSVDPDRIAAALVDHEGIAAGRDAPARLSPRIILEVEQDVFEQRLETARTYAALNDLNPVDGAIEDAWIGVVASGATYHEVIESLASLGFDDEALARAGVRLLRLGMVYPLDRDIVRRFARGLQQVLVVEDKREFVETAVRDALYGSTDPPVVVGKLDERGRRLLPSWGAIDADRLRRVLAERLRGRLEIPRPPREARATIPLVAPGRTPFFCSGCPHNTSTKVPEGAKLGGGIGCHSMVAFMDEDRVGKITGTTQMGGEGAQWIGASPFVDTPHLFQNLGDGTFFHSGQLAVQAAVAANTNITYKLLFNGFVSMTGGQEAVGAQGASTVIRTLLDQGVRRVIVTADDPERYRRVALPDGAELWDRSRIVEAQEALRETGGVTVLLHDQVCAAEARRLRKRGMLETPPMRVVIDERICEGCGDCGVKSNCLSVVPVDTEFGRKTAIDQTSCNKDYSCLQGDCPSFVTIVPRRPRWWRRGSRLARSAKALGQPELPPDPGVLAEPVAVVPSDDFRVRMPGVGGSGVVTVSQVLGTAAQLAGFEVAGLDQTGLAQKGGSVVSDLRLSRRPIEGTNRASTGTLDLLLVFDLLVGVSPVTLLGADPRRTVAVVSTAEVPTGSMVSHVDEAYPDASRLCAVIADATRADRRIEVDAPRFSASLFGATTFANVLLLGIAYQLGAVPVPAESIERALELNGVAVAANKLAFRYGRLWIADRASVEARMQRRTDHSGADGTNDPLDPWARESTEALAIPPELARRIAIRAMDLVDYQNQAYADRYIRLISTAVDAERTLFGSPGDITLAVVCYHHKLLAYKDEYEIARLALRPDAPGVAPAAAVGSPASAAFHLHPPVMRAMGLEHKLRIPVAIGLPVLRVLRSMRRVRGTALDPFGRAKMRRLERQLVDDYEALVEVVLSRLSLDNRTQIAELLSLPDLVRGYENVKLANVDRYQAAVRKGCSALGL